MFFWKIFSAKVLRGVLPKLQKGVLKNTGWCYTKIWRDDLKKVV